MEEQAPPVVWYQVLHGTDPLGPWFAAFDRHGPVIASVSEIEVPWHAWQVTLRHKGWEKRRTADFATLDRAKQAVEKWAAHHWREVPASTRKAP